MDDIPPTLPSPEEHTKGAELQQLFGRLYSVLVGMQRRRRVALIIALLEATEQASHSPKKNRKNKNNKKKQKKQKKQKKRLAVARARWVHRRAQTALSAKGARALPDGSMVCQHGNIKGKCPKC